MINWRKPTEVPEMFKDIIGLTYGGNIVTGYVNLGQMFVGTFDVTIQNKVAFTEYIELWCYQEELLETIPKEMK